ncbi:MAG: cupredoxin domain-containing protein [Dehalococcoidales bacterium]|jgi:plastocyanin
MKKLFLLLPAILLCIALALTACSSSSPITLPPTTTPPSTTPPTTTPPPTTSAPAPGITITSPTGGVIPQIGDVTVTVQVSNFSIVDKMGQAKVAGEGHIHYFLDVQPPTDPTKAAVTAPGTYAATIATSYTWHNVGGGPHTFYVELVNNDHAPLSPAVVTSVTDTVLPEIGPATAVITSPKEGSVLPPGDITATVQISNFNLVDKIDQANVPGEGHIHYYLDVDAPTTQGVPAEPDHGIFAHATTTSYTFGGVGVGSHFIAIELVNNDSTPLNPPVVAKVNFLVQGTSTPTPTPTATGTPTPTAAPQSVTINLTAQGMAFDLSTITVPAGASVTLVFTNKDTGIPHNFALYTDSTASKSIFIGQIIRGTNTVTYTFTAPSTPGSYFFRCDVHPTSMIGTFVVQ